MTSIATGDDGQVPAVGFDRRGALAAGSALAVGISTLILPAGGAAASEPGLGGDGLAAPASVTTTAGDLLVSASWDAVAGATGYELQVKVATSDATAYQTVGTVDANTRELALDAFGNAPSIANGIAYDVRVRALGAGDLAGAWTVAATAAAPAATATGGSVSIIGTDRVHVFTGGGTFTLSVATTVRHLIVGGGGGGGGGSHVAGGTGGGGTGGGGGQVVTGSASRQAQAWQVLVGSGGTGGAGSDKFSWNGADGTAGASSSVFGLAAAGGGEGIGGGWDDPTNDTNGGFIWTDGLPGYAGGASGSGNLGGGRGGTVPQVDTGAGGGGGQTTAGSAGSGAVGGGGGAGTTSDLTGDTESYGGGGGGGGAAGVGGTAAQGGGQGAGSQSATATAGTARSGGGGGGGRGGDADSAGGTSDPGAGAAGGSGLVVLRYSLRP